MTSLLLAGLLIQPVTRTQTLLDFEAGPLNQAVQAAGTVRVSRTLNPEGGPKGSSIEVKAEANAIVAGRLGLLPPNIDDVVLFSFWVYRSEKEVQSRPQSALDLVFLEEDGRTRFRRRVDLNHSGWKQIRVAPKWMAPDSGRIPLWSKIKRFGFSFRGTTEILIDDVSVEIGEKGRGQLVPQDLWAPAFPNTVAAKIFRVESARRVLVTDVAAADLKRLDQEFAQVDALLEKRVGDWVANPRPPVFILFGQESEYKAFPPVLANLFNRVASPPTSDGFTLLGVATGTWSPEKGGIQRPSLIHEYAHAALEQNALLQNRGEWLQEGLASQIQLELRPQKDFAALVKRGLSDPSIRMPWSRLTDGDPIGPEFYWQALTLVETLQTAPKFKDRWSTLMQAVRLTGSTRLETFLKSIYSVDWGELEAAWLTHCRTRYR